MGYWSFDSEAQGPVPPGIWTGGSLRYPFPCPSRWWINFCVPPLLFPQVSFKDVKGTIPQPNSTQNMRFEAKLIPFRSISRMWWSDADKKSIWNSRRRRYEYTLVGKFRSKNSATLFNFCNSEFFFKGQQMHHRRRYIKTFKIPPFQKCSENIQEVKWQLRVWSS